MRLVEVFTQNDLPNDLKCQRTGYYVKLTRGYKRICGLTEIEVREDSHREIDVSRLVTETIALLVKVHKRTLRYKQRVSVTDPVGNRTYYPYRGDWTIVDNLEEAAERFVDSNLEGFVLCAASKLHDCHVFVYMKPPH